MDLVKKLEQTLVQGQEFDLNEDQLYSLQGALYHKLSKGLRYYLEKRGYVDGSKLFNEYGDFIGDMEEFILVEDGKKAPLAWMTTWEHRAGGCDKRECLTCSEVFESANKFNRVCEDCSTKHSKSA